VSGTGRAHVLPRPFLKWVGGKGQLLPELTERVKKAGKFGRYHEPFVGGGALFFELVRQKMLGSKQAYLSDNNTDLITAYEGVRNHVDELIAKLKVHRAKHSKEYFYEMRAHVPSDRSAQTARIIYLNKSCFNGLYRVNSRGLFNVPFGDYKNPAICDEEVLRAASAALKHAKLDVRHFQTVVDVAERGDLVYFDPPYHPTSKTSSFTSYEKSGFGEDSQRLLADVMQHLDDKGVKVLLSNSYTDLVRSLYKGFKIDQVLAKRSVNSRADGRGKIAEALVRNF
jgi:DNA adenine methylase